MGCICSRARSRKDKKEKNKEGSKGLTVYQVVDPRNREDVSQKCKTEGPCPPQSMHGTKDMKNEKMETAERPKDGHPSRRTKENELLANTLPTINSIPGGVKGEQIAAGWPTWLTSVAAEAVQGWVPRSAESFEKLNKIGQGTYSSVYKARDLQNNKLVAMKKVRFINMDPESVCFMAREICILRRLDHPNVMKLEALVTSKISGNLYLVFDYMEHDLAGLTASQKVKFTEPQIKCYMQQLLYGLEHCHSRGILHRDIKGSNLLVNNKGVLKIGDFGLAKHLQPDDNEPLTSRVVTLWYRAPELLFGSTSYGVGIDMWSAGCILAELFTGKAIMPGRTEVEQIHKIFKLCGSPSEEYWRKSKLPHATCFKPQRPYKRCVAETFKHLPSSALALVDTLLAIEPDKRGTAASALCGEFLTTEPLPCDPSSMPEYPPSKTYDAKLREDHTRRRKAENGKRRGRGSVKEGHGERKPRSKGQGQSHKSTSEKYNPLEGSGAIDLSTGMEKNGFSHSNSMIHKNAVGDSWTKNVKVDGSHTSLRIRHSRHDRALKGQMSNVHQALDSFNNQPMGRVHKRNKINCSGPMMPPGGNTKDLLKEHARQIQEAITKTRHDNTKTKAR